MNTLVYRAALILLKQHYKVEPGEMQTLMSFTYLAWSIKIIFGLISDNIPILGSRRKSYLLIMAVLQFVCMIVLGVTKVEDLSLNAVSWMLFCSNLSIAFSDVIVDSLAVIQARQYPEDGSEELTSYSWTCSSIGGFFGSITAAYMVEHYEPRYFFLYESMVCLFIVIIALRMNVSLEKDSQEKDEASE